ncbi:MAG TPA: AraC family transcriptional regulator [Gemmatimonadales bacterium]|nr:AraC family transcriptional regulator [Gemmatimonadales bacterium]
MPLLPGTTGMARIASVPISMGASGAKTLALDDFLVTEARFPAHERLPPHVHDRAALAVMLEGCFDLSITHRVYACEPGSAVAEPAEERHGNVLGTSGAHVVVIQPDPLAVERWGPCGRLFDQVRHAAQSPVCGVAWRIARELQTPDSATPLAVEGLAFEMLALAWRRDRLEARARRAPPWLARTRDQLHAQFRDPPRVRELAAAAGVHPDHLARAFRVRFGVPVGTYVRGLRLDWAATRLAATDEAIAQIALEAGFADQSHFTRAFRRHTGLTPGEYRRA